MVDTNPVRYSHANDAFAAKLDCNGALQWNTFLGGSDDDTCRAITVDGSGNVYVGGNSKATWQGSTAPRREYQENSDAFAAKLDSSGALVWNTFLGGSGADEGWGIDVDGSANVYLSGMSGNSWQGDDTPKRAHRSGYDAFAAMLSSSGDLQWNTFLGGEDSDYGRAIAVDGSGNVYVGGESRATWGEGEGVVTSNPIREYTSALDAFAAKLDSSGVLQWNTFLGAASDDYGRSIAVDADGSVYVGGSSWATWQGDSEPVRPHDAGSNLDAFAATLDSSGALQWSTFMGGTGSDQGFAIAVDDNGSVHLGGVGDAAWGAPVRTFETNNDAFAVKLGSDGSLPTQTSVEVEIALSAGWNMVSVPLELTDAACDAVFPPPTWWPSTPGIRSPSRTPCPPPSSPKWATGSPSRRTRQSPYREHP